MPVFIALLALNGCIEESSGRSGGATTPPKVEPDQGDLGGIADRLSEPVHLNSIPETISGTNATARINWGEGVRSGTFQYTGGREVKAEVTVTAKTGYVFSETLKESDIQAAFSKVTGIIDKGWALSTDYTELTFSFSYTVARATVPQTDYAGFIDLIPVAGSTVLPDYLARPVDFTGIKTASNIVYYAANADLEANPPPTALTTLPPAGTGFQAKIELEARYGYTLQGFNPTGFFPGADQILGPKSSETADKTEKLSFVLYYRSGLISITPNNFYDSFTLLLTAPFAPGHTVPAKVISLENDAVFSASGPQWSTDNLEGGEIVFGGRPVSVTIELTPKKGYTFIEPSGITASEIQDAFTIPYNQGSYPLTQDLNVPLVEIIGRSPKLVFTLTYNVSYVEIVPNDLKSLGGSTTGSPPLPLEPFRAPRTGQPVRKAVTLHDEAKFTGGSIIWSDQVGYSLASNYPVTPPITASVTLKAKPGFLFSSTPANTTGFASALAGTSGIFYDSSDPTLYRNPTAAIVGTPGETLVFTLQYNALNPAILTTSNGTPAANSAVLNSGGGLAEIFDAITGNKLIILGDSNNAIITLDRPAVIPAGKTLELSADTTLSTGTNALDAKGNIILLGDSKLILASDNPTTANTIGGTSIQGSSGASAVIELKGNGNLDIVGTVTATNVTLNVSNTVAGSAKLNIKPNATLTLGTGSTLEMAKIDATKPGDSGTIHGTVVIESGAKLLNNDSVANAWEVGETGVITIKYGGLATTRQTHPDYLVGTDKSDDTAGIIQLKNGAALDLEKDDYILWGNADIVAAFEAANTTITVAGELTLKGANFTLIGSSKIIGGATNGVKLIVAAGKKITISGISTSSSESLPGITLENGAYTNKTSSDTTFTWNNTNKKWTLP